MNEENFKTNIEGLKSIRLTPREKVRMLEKIFATPIRSPFMRRIPVFAYVYSFILIISIGGVTYASSSSLPGDVLYSVKIGVVESLLDVVNYAPEDKIVWEGQKVERRIVEAEKLIEKNKLDDRKIEELERKIEKSSKAFVEAINVAASSTATSSESRREKNDKLKEEFRRKVNEHKEKVENKEDDREDKEDNDRKNLNLRRLKDAAIRAVDIEREGN